MNWRQILVSKLSRDPEGAGVEEFRSLTDGCSSHDYAIIAQVSQQPQKHLHYLANHAGYTQMGTFAPTGETLGYDHKYAHEEVLRRNGEWEKGRRIFYCHAYSSPTGQGSIPPFETLIHGEKERLETLLTQAHEANPPPGWKDPRIEKKPALIDALPVGFHSITADAVHKGILSKAWNKIAREMEQGKHDGKIALFDEKGNHISMIDVLEPSMSKSMGVDPMAFGIAAAAEKKNLGMGKPLLNQMVFLQVAMISCCVLAGALTWRWLENERRREEAQRKVMR